MGSLFKSSKQTSSSRVELPGWANEGLKTTANRAIGLMDQPYQGYGAERVAGLSDWTGAGVDAVQGVAGYQPGSVNAPMVNAPGGINPAMVGAGQVTPGMVGAQRVTPGSLAGRDLSAYYDPYQREVIDAAMGDIDRSTRAAQAGRAAGGVQAAGFGGFGDRASVAAAEIERAGIDAKARTAAGLRSQGFQRAQDMAVGDIGRDFQGQSMNAQMGMQAGLANQQAGMAGQQFNASSAMQAALANQQAGMTAQQFGAGQQMQAALANQQAGLGAQQFNVSSGLDAARTRAMAGQQLAGLGEVERGVRQAGLDAGYQDFRERRDDPFLKTQWAAGVIGGNASPYAGNVTQTTPGPSAFSQILGAGMSAAQIYAMSDPNEKTDKRRVGTDPDTGLGIWSFRYKGDPKSYPKVVGPMADEVEERYPDLVRRVGGRRAIDMRGLAALGGEGRGYADGGLYFGAGSEMDEPMPLGLGLDQIRASAMPQPMIRAPRLDVADMADDADFQRRYASPRLDVAGMPDDADFQEQYRAVPGVGSGAPGFAGESSAPPVTWGGAAAGEGMGMGMGEGIILSPDVTAALDRIRARRAGGGPGPAAGARAPQAAPDAMPAEPPMPVSVPMGGQPAAAPVARRAEAPADQRSWLQRFADRLVDPDYAGNVALLQAGLGMMASRNPNWAGAIGEGALLGLQAAERARPLVRGRRQQQEFQEFLRGLPDPTAVSAPIAPRRAAPGERPQRMTSVAVPPAGPLVDRVAGAESGDRDDARNPAPGSTASGRLQITDALWSDYAPRLGLSDDQRNSAEGQRAVFAAFEADMRRDLPAVLGREATDEDVYAAWGLGPAGFRALAANPDADAFEAYRSAAGETRARQAFSQNGALMRQGMRAGEVLDAWRGRLPGAAARAEAPSAAARPERGAGAERAVAAAEPEPTIQVGGRRLNRDQLLTMMAAMPENEAVQRFVATALPVLNAEVARRENAADRAQARSESADLRRELAGRGREPQPTNLNRLITERDALPPGDPRRAAYDAAIRRETGEGAAERFTPAQAVQLRRDAFTAARQEAGGLDFASEADRSGWINQRARELVNEWGVPEVLNGGGGGAQAVPLSGSGRPEAPDATADNGARIRPRGPARVLSEGARRTLMTLGEAAAQWPALTRDWKDDYGGFVADWVGDTANFVARRTPGDSPRADWWARYQEQSNNMLRELSGAAVTLSEAERFRRAMISPGMTPEAIRSRLREQAAAAQRGAQKLANSYVVGGYNRREVEAALGIPIPEDAPAPGAGAISGPDAQRDRPAPQRGGNSLEQFLPGGGR